MKSFSHALCVYPYKREKLHWNFLPPLGLEYIATAIEDLVDSVSVIDLRYEKDTIEKFITRQTDVVCISLNWRSEKNFFLEAIRRIPRSVYVIVGGRYATENVIELFQSCPNIDVIIRGDGEETIRKLFISGKPDGIGCVSYRHNGQIIHNPNTPLPPVSNTLIPNRELRRYKYTISPAGFDSRIPIDMVASSRGCPFRCKFCTFNTNPFGQKREWSGRSPESIVEELRRISAPIVGFTDDLFTWDMERVDQLCELLLKKQIRKKYIFNARIDIAKHPDVLRKMYLAGFRVPLIGIESCHDKTLKAIDKGFTIKEIKSAFKTLRKFNFLLHCCFIIGHIGEDEKEMLHTASFARKLGIDGISVQRLRCEKYSPLREIVANTPGYHIREGEIGFVYSDKYSPSALKKISRKVVFRFYLPFHIFKVGYKLLTSGLATPLAILCCLLSIMTRFIPRRKEFIANRLRSTLRKRRKPSSHPS